MNRPRTEATRPQAPASLPAHTSSLLPHGPRPPPGAWAHLQVHTEHLHPPFLKQEDLSLRYGASCVALTCWAQGAWNRTAHVCFGKKFPLPKGPACSRKPLTVLINTCSLRVREALIVDEMVFWFPDY